MSIKCIQCGYPVIEQMTSCPNCGNIVSDKESPAKITCPNCGLQDIESYEEYCPECGHPLNVQEEEYIMDDPVAEVLPICTLTPLSQRGERQMSQRTYEDQGDGVSLTRGNTMPSDPSIDEELQAHLFFYEGNWYVEEGVEERRSTYVHAGKGIKLTSGDIIRLGDREFEFNITTI